jgi:hypothetical protein
VISTHSVSRKITQACIDKLKAGEIRSIEESHRVELELAEDELDWAASRHYHSEALTHQVAISQDEEYWRTSRQLGVTFLSRAGAQKVRADIRAERKANWDFWATRVTFVLALIGSVFGVLAYFKK